MGPRPFVEAGHAVLRDWPLWTLPWMSRYVADETRLL